MPKRYRTPAIWIFLVAVLQFAVAEATPTSVSIGTPLLTGQPAILAFDFIDGGSPQNAVSVVGFASDGTLGSISTIGDVTGALPGMVTLSDGSFFNEYAQAIELGSILSFIFDATANPPDANSFPDSFAFFLLNPVTGFSLVTTSDPTGADALFLYSIGDAVPLAIYTSEQVNVTAIAAPEPASLPLVLAGAIALCMVRRRHRVRAQI